MLNGEDVLKLKSVLATKEDITEIRTELKGDILELRTELKGDILELRTELKQDISDSQDKIMSVVATKQELQEVKDDMTDLKELLQSLIVSTDSIAKSIGNLSLEYAAITSQLSRHDNWIKQIAEKVGLKLITD